MKGPSPVISGVKPYKVPRAKAPVDLRLDANEGPMPPISLLEDVAAHDLRSYPVAAQLEAQIAANIGVRAEHVLVTAGGDESIDRLMRAYLSPQRSIVIPVPTFGMISKYARLTGARILEVPWQDVWPLDDVLSLVEQQAPAVITVVSPNNPTGEIIREEKLKALSQAAPESLLLVDLAYTEFADHDLTPVVLSLPNAIGIRTLSKAYGLAGLRCGYAFSGVPELLAPLRAVGGPYPVAGPSLSVASRALQDGVIEPYVRRIKVEREGLSAALEEGGATCSPSQGNFAFAQMDKARANAAQLRDRMAGLGIGIRSFDDLNAVRITCPGNHPDLLRVLHAVHTCLNPEALIFDMDGVLVDVSASYRQAIILTAADFGEEVTAEDIAVVKKQGNANNDWEVTRRILASRGKDVAIEEITKIFEAYYHGTDDREGLWRQERLLITRDYLQSLHEKLPLAIVTGRPRLDAERLLAHFDLAGYFSALVCMEDAPLKPDPAPVLRALSILEVRRAWMIGDTPDDIRAARAAGVIPFGILAPGEAEDMIDVLFQAGAASVLRDVNSFTT